VRQFQKGPGLKIFTLGVSGYEKRLVAKKSRPCKFAEPASLFSFRLLLAQDGDLPDVLVDPATFNPYLYSIQVNTVGQVFSRQAVGVPVKLAA